jgi:hypothetical protein
MVKFIRNINEPKKYFIEVINDSRGNWSYLKKTIVNINDYQNYLDDMHYSSSSRMQYQQHI